jgi:hypothetical protein
MSRYFTAPRSAHYVEDEYYAPEPGRIADVFVPDHHAVETGILDAQGDMIMRAPNPVGFGRDAEW